MKTKHIQYLLCLIIALGTVTANARNYRKDFEERKKYHHFQLVDSAYKYNIVVFAVSPSIKPDTETSYTWYINNTVHTTQGNYGGKLLHGSYVKYFIDSKQLAAKGNYKKGLRTGNWYEWYENGNLTSVIKYKKGQKNGKALFYDTAGNLTEECSFRKDKKNGKSIAYINSVKQAPVKYKNGVVIEKKKKLSKEEKQALKEEKAKAKQVLKEKKQEAKAQKEKLKKEKNTAPKSKTVKKEEKKKENKESFFKRIFKKKKEKS